MSPWPLSIPLVATLLVPEGDESYALDQALTLLHKQKILHSNREGRYRVTHSGRALLGFYATGIRHLLPDADRNE